MFDGPFIFHVLQYFMLLDHLHIHNPEVSELNRRCVKVTNLSNEVQRLADTTTIYRMYKQQGPPVQQRKLYTYPVINYNGK